MRKHLLLVALALAALVGAVSACAEDDTASGGIETNSANRDNPPPDDIDDGWVCEEDELGWVVARGTLTNHSSKTSTYTIEVAFEAGGVQYATATAFVNNVAAGGQAEWEAQSFTDARPDTSCRIVQVDRWAS